MSADDWTGLGIDERLAAAADAAGFDEPTPVQRALLPVLRRGGNVIVPGGSGSGARTGIALGVLDRLVDGEPADGARVLVVTSTADDAAALARTWSRLGVPAGVRAAHIASATVTGAAVLIASIAEAMRRVRSSELKLDAIGTFVVDGFDAIVGLEGAESLDTLVGLLPEDAQRVVRVDEEGDAVDTFATRSMRRPFRVEPKGADEGAGALGGVRLRVVVVEEADKTDALAALLGTDAQATVHARSASRAEDVAGELRLHGLAAEADAREVAVGGGAGVQVSHDVPAHAGELARRHADGGTVLCRPRELPHLRRLADVAGASLEPAEPPRRRSGDAVEAFRDEVRRALGEQDIDAQLLLLEPLFRERSAAEVAAALSALLRTRMPAAPAAAESAPAAAPAPGAQPAGAPAPPTTWTRLFVGIGERDNARPSDLVGAITGEANVRGDQVGKIEMRESYTVVEVETPIARKVIEALNGRTVRGRSLRVDYDRKESGAGGGAGRSSDREGRGAGGPRGGGPRGGGPAGPRGGSGGPRGASGGPRGGSGGPRGGSGGPRGGSGGSRGGGPSRGGGARGGPGSRGGTGGGPRRGPGGGSRGGPGSGPRRPRDE